MSFEVASDAYGRYMGRYSEQLSVLFADSAGIAAGMTALDVGCGPGAMTQVLVDRLGAGNVAAIDPSGPFVQAAHLRFPTVDISQATAEKLPFDADVFDAAVAELVVHFMTDPVAGLREMARVTKPGGTIAACVWDHGGDTGAVSPFWKVARVVTPGIDDESGLAGVREGQLEQLFAQAGLRDIRPSKLTVSVEYATFDEWWEPYTTGVGPAGEYVAGIDEGTRAALRVACASSLGPAPFTVHASAWNAVGTV